MRNFTSFGNDLVALVVVALVSQDLTVVFQVALGLLAIFVIGHFIKVVIFRERPRRETFSNMFEKMESGSFPSMHVARSTFAYSFLFAYLSFPYTFIPFALVLIVGVSRVYLKKHYIVDTLFGLLLGLAMFYFSNLFF